MRNLSRITNYYNRLQAQADWRKLADQATAAGHADLAQRYQPPADAGWRKIDHCIDQLREALEQTNKE